MLTSVPGEAKLRSCLGTLELKTAQVGNIVFRAGSGYRTLKISGFNFSTYSSGHSLGGDQTTKSHGVSQI